MGMHVVKRVMRAMMASRDQDMFAIHFGDSRDIERFGMKIGRNDCV
jgi:hypothetical protein